MWIIIEYFISREISPRNFLQVLIICICFSCTKEIELDPSCQPDLYVLNSLISSQEDIQFFLGQTSLMSDTSDNSIEDLSVILLENGINVAVNAERTNDCFNLHYKPIERKNYRIEIYLIGQNDPLIAEDSVPSSIQLTDATYRFPVYKDQHDMTWGDLKITFADEKNTSNFYELVLLNRSSRLIQSFNVNNPAISQDSEKDPILLPTMLFTDETFKDSTIVLHVFTGVSDNPTILLRNVSYNFYQYKKNLYQHLNNQNISRYDIYDIFKGDPMDLYSNVKNGLGIFAAYSQSLLIARSEQ